MPLFHKSLVPETERTFAGASLTASYQTIGTPLAHASTMMIWVNNTGVIVKVSFNGVNDHFTLLAGATVIFDENANAVSSAEYKTPNLTQFYVRTTGVAGSDNIYFDTFYSK